MVVVTQIEVLITGDLNFHIDDINDSDARKFIQTLSDHGLQQHVNGATHVRGNTLDVIITRENSSLLLGSPPIQDPHLCDLKGNPSGDHFALFTRLNVTKPPRRRKTVALRKYRDIDIDAFKLDIENSLDLPVHERSPETYNSKMRLLVEKHALLQTKQITLRPNTEWYTSELWESKRERRKAERKMRKTGLTIHKQIYRENCISANRLLFKCKKDFYCNKIFEAGGNQKQLHRLTNNLMGNKHEIILPLHSDELELSNKFNQFFLGNIETIRNNLNLQNSTSHESVDFLRADTKFDGHPLALFTPVSTVEVKKIIMKTAPKSCELDPIPTSLLKQCLDSMLPFIADIINDSLGESCVPPLFKAAIVRP